MSRLFSFSHLTAGFVAVLVGYSSSAIIVFQAATVAGANAEEISSWLWALGVGMGSTCIGLSLYYRTPVMTAWSTPGAALLVTGLSGVSLNEAVGTFLFCSLLTTLCGVMGWFDQIVRHIPKTLACAMLAGILLRFGLEVFIAAEKQLLLVGGMFTTYVFCKRKLPRFAIPFTLVTGLVLAISQGLLEFDSIQWELAKPVAIVPEFSLSTLIGVGLPLFVVTMASQNIPGIAVLRANGYTTPSSPLIGWTGVTGMVLAPFGGFTFNLSAITAAICMGKDADPDPNRRYLATIWAGLFYILAGVFGATVVSLFAAFPSELVMAIAGLALLGTIGNSLADALKEETERDAALVTFIVTASGLSLAGIGSAFWGGVAGLIVHRILGTRTF